MPQHGACARCVLLYHVSLSAGGCAHAAGVSPAHMSHMMCGLREPCRASEMAKALNVLATYHSFHHDVSALNHTQPA
jgi:hypothetical protein